MVCKMLDLIDDHCIEELTFRAKDASSSSEVKGAFSFITWNVDGLDKRNLSPRTTNLISILKRFYLLNN
jgi:hypothetical protein